MKTSVRPGSATAVEAAAGAGAVEAAVSGGTSSSGCIDSIGRRSRTRSSSNKVVLLIAVVLLVVY